MKTLQTALFILFGLFWSVQLPAVTINGQIENSSGSPLVLNVLFGRSHFPADDIIIEVDDTGQFRQEVALAEIRFAELKIGKRTLKLFLDPTATTITINMDEKNFVNTIKFSGHCALENEYLYQHALPNHHLKLLKLTGDQRYNPGAVDHFASTEEAYAIGMLDEIKDLIQPENYDMLLKEIQSYFLTIRLMAGITVGQARKEEYEAHWMIRNDQLGLEIDCSSRNRYGPHYNTLIHTYYSHLHLKFNMDFPRDTTRWLSSFGLQTRQDLNFFFRRDKNNMLHYVLGKEEMCAPAFEKLLANRIYESLNNGNFENLLIIYEAFKTRYPQSPFLDKLAPKMASIYEFERTKNQPVEGIDFFPNLVFDTGIEKVIQQEKYRGSVLLLHFWGTWGGPCREQLPHLKELIDSLQEEKVQHLHFADEISQYSESYWMETAKFFHLKGDHYLVETGHIFQFLKKIGAFEPTFTYPTYMIVDRQGEVILPKAAVPSDREKLLEQINSGLEE